MDPHAAACAPFDADAGASQAAAPTPETGPERPCAAHAAKAPERAGEDDEEEEEEEDEVIPIESLEELHVADKDERFVPPPHMPFMPHFPFDQVPGMPGYPPHPSSDPAAYAYQYFPPGFEAFFHLPTHHHHHHQPHHHYAQTCPPHFMDPETLQHWADAEAAADAGPAPQAQEDDLAFLDAGAGGAEVPDNLSFLDPTPRHTQVPLLLPSLPPPPPLSFQPIAVVLECSSSLRSVRERLCAGARASSASFWAERPPSNTISV